LKIFLNADDEDRNGMASKKTAKTFLAASVFLELLKVFGETELDPDVQSKMI
jgi:vacuolar protein sorting-associated protein VTA1